MSKTEYEIIEELLKGTSLEGCCELALHGSPWVRYDFDSCDSREQQEIYYSLVDELKDVGLQFDDPQIEHDCISGNLMEDEEHLATRVESLERRADSLSQRALSRLNTVQEDNEKLKEENERLERCLQVTDASWKKLVAENIELKMKLQESEHRSVQWQFNDVMSGLTPCMKCQGLGRIIRASKSWPVCPDCQGFGYVKRESND